MAQQLDLPLIPHEYQGQLVQQRAKDGYINATAMCKAAGREWKRYRGLESTDRYLKALGARSGKTSSELIQTLTGGHPQLQGTWVHPQVAIHLAQWLSEEFAVQVSEWVHEWVSGKRVGPAEMPYHLRRYVTNRKNVPRGHFSILTELTMCLVAPLEDAGYTLPQNLWPDISEGKMFCKFIRDVYGIDTNTLPTYPQALEDGRIVQAKAYPNEWLAPFREHFETVWLPQKARQYFTERDPKALAYLPKLLPAPTRAA